MIYNIVATEPQLKISLNCNRLDSISAPRFIGEINELLEERKRTVEINFEEVTFIDSTGIGALVEVAATMEIQRGVTLSGLNESSLEIFELTCMDVLFNIIK